MEQLLARPVAKKVDEEPARAPRRLPPWIPLLPPVQSSSLATKPTNAPSVCVQQDQNQVTVVGTGKENEMVGDGMGKVDAMEVKKKKKKVYRSTQQRLQKSDEVRDQIKVQDRQ